MTSTLQRRNLEQKLADLTKPVTELDEGILISATYDGDLRKAVLKFYDAKSDRVALWFDNTGHRPYCYTKLPQEELQGIRNRKDVIEIVEEEKLDLLADSKISIRKIVATDPLAIGGGQNSIRDEIRAWEADIKYYENYAYDRGLRMGVYYKIKDDKISPIKMVVPERVSRSVEEISKKNPPEFAPYIQEWAELLGQPLKDFQRIALDIEVANEAGRMPDPEDPVRPIIAVSFFNDNEKLVYLLSRKNDDPHSDTPLPFKLVKFEKEADLIRAAFDKIMDYPMIVSFNGDDFDLRYLKHRADKPEIGISEDENPIVLERVAASLKHGIHVDLYQFFRNKSIQVYAFGNKYSEHTLNGITEALLGKSKLEFEGEIGDLPPIELANYCINDSQLTYELTSMRSSVVIKLLTVISRVGKMPLNDVSRLGVSNWIRSMLFYEHRKLNALIPRKDELSEKGGASSEPIIKGKKYRGGLVMEPQPGVYFDVSVLDFASLYPSLIKVHNLSYETVNCPHEECRSNKIPETSHWVCTRRKGVTSLVIGSLRDLRVGHYKQLAKDPTMEKDEVELNNIVSQGLKVFLNASYGVTGFETFAFYCLPVAEATAALGRYAITKTIDQCKSLGINVLYSDTDSLYLASPSREQLTTIRKWSGEELGVELDLEKTYRYVAFSSRKKNYFGVLPDGTVDIKGLTGKKSVDGSTPMIARVDGDVAFTNVEDVYEKYKKFHRVEVVTVTDDLRSLWVPISDAMAHEVHEVYKVRTSKGRSLVLSGDHSVYLMDNFGRLFCKDTRNLRRGDVVVGAQFVPPVGNETDVYFSHYLADVTKIEKGRLYSRKAHSTTGITLPLKVPLNDEFAFLLGAFTSEGNATSVKRSRGSSISQDPKLNTEVCSRIEAAWEKTFCWKVKKHNETRYYVPTLYAELFKRLCGGDSGDKHVPPFIFSSRTQVIREYLRGIFSGDGYGDGKRVNLLSKSKELVIGIAYLLAFFDIDCRIRNVDVPKYGRYYQISIIGASSRKCFYKRIGFLQPRFKGEVLTRPLNKELIPISTSGLLAVKQAILGREGRDRLRGINFHDRRLYNLSLLDKYNNVIGALLEHANDEERRTLRGIALMLNNRDVSLDEVVSISKLKGPRQMYDFSVPHFERFAAGNLPTLLHNSQTPEYLKETFYKSLKILSGVKNPSDFERARKETRELLTRMVSQLKNKEVPIQQLAFNVMIGKPTASYKDNTPQHVKAAELLQKNGREIKAGEIISFVKTKIPPYVKPTELARADEIDSEKYIDYARATFDQILDALDFSFEEIMGATTLDLFWSR